MEAWGRWIAAGTWLYAERVVVCCAINLQGGLLTSSPGVRCWSLASDFAGVEATRCFLRCIHFTTKSNGHSNMIQVGKSTVLLPHNMPLPGQIMSLYHTMTPLLPPILWVTSWSPPPPPRNTANPPLADETD